MQVPKEKPHQTGQNGGQGVHDLLGVEQLGTRRGRADAVDVDNMVAERRNGALDLEQDVERRGPAKRE